jgi:hypothetical protein
MAGRPLGRKNLRSFLASNELERLGINPIEKAAQCIKEFDDLIQMNIQAYTSGRGLSERGDLGATYLANAIRGVSEKTAIYITMAKFTYPTLSAIAVKDFNSENNNEKPMTSSEAIEIISNDPFFKGKVETKDIIEAMDKEPSLLPNGVKND